MPHPYGLPISVVIRLGELVHAALDQLRGPAQDLGPLGHGPRRPVGGVERRAGRGHGVVDVGVGALGHPTGHLFGERVDDVDGAGAGGLHELAADVETVVDDHCNAPLVRRGWRPTPYPTF
jgi:hypothetical protein